MNWSFPKRNPRGGRSRNKAAEPGIRLRGIRRFVRNFIFRAPIIERESEPLSCGEKATEPLSCGEKATKPLSRGRPVCRGIRSKFQREPRLGLPAGKLKFQRGPRRGLAVGITPQILAQVPAWLAGGKVEISAKAAAGSGGRDNPSNFSTSPGSVCRLGKVRISARVPVRSAGWTGIWKKNKCARGGARGIFRERRSFIPGRTVYEKPEKKTYSVAKPRILGNAKKTCNFLSLYLCFPRGYGILPKYGVRFAII